jgi:hypothetical protein
MNGKIITAIFLTLVISSIAFPVNATIKENIPINPPKEMFFQNVPIKDQYQESVERGKCGERDFLQNGEWQQFVPWAEFLFYVEVYVGCWDINSDSIVLLIRNSNGGIDGLAQKSASELPLNKEDWVPFYFNTSLIIGETYKLEFKIDSNSKYSWWGSSSTVNASHWNLYNPPNNPYIFGDSSRNDTSNPEYIEDWDYCFRTYSNLNRCYIYDVADPYAPNSDFQPGGRFSHTGGIDGYIDNSGLTGWGSIGDEYLIYTEGWNYTGPQWGLVYNVQTAGNPDDHPKYNGNNIASRSYNLIKDPVFMGNYSSGNVCAFHVDNTGIYYGASDNFRPRDGPPGWGTFKKCGIWKWNFNFQGIGHGNLVVPTPCPNFWGIKNGSVQTLTYNHIKDEWWCGENNGRGIYKWNPNPPKWEYLFSHPRVGCRKDDQHSGMEIVGKYLFIAEMIDDKIIRYELDSNGNVQNKDVFEVFSYWDTWIYQLAKEHPNVQGMGYGPNNHLWLGSGRGIFEVGGLIPSAANLECSGGLTWTNVNPGTTQIGSFTLKNIGDSSSKLDWKVISQPSWGNNWKFVPKNGNDLKPSDGIVTVQVSVDAPNQGQSTFYGEIKVINEEDSSDFEIIPIKLITTKNKALQTSSFLQFLQNHPNLFPILQKLLQQLGL